MNNRANVVAVIPDEMRNLVVEGVKAPITILHTNINCQRCNRTCWIGPEQRNFAAHGINIEIVCYICMLEDPEILALVDNSSIVGLNRDADDLPRMTFPED